MNREIIFRAKSKSTNTWLYGDLLRNEQGAFAVVPPFKMNMSNECNLYEVDKETVGQFTGLYDKAQKPIYEGDILGNGERVVGWVKGGVRGYCYDVVYVNHPTGEKRWTLYGTVEHDFPNKIEVIGTIYDNADLLEE